MTHSVADAADVRKCPPSRPRHLAEVVFKHRWPTWLALLMTFDNLIDPSVPSPWILLILPAGYLAIGAARKALRPPRVLALQLGGLLGYLTLVLVAVSVSQTLALYLVAAGWLGHALWDLAHYRARKIVPRAYAEWCGVIDTVIGLSVLLFLL